MRGKVPEPGYYTFVLHYYQPDYPGKWGLCLNIDKKKLLKGLKISVDFLLGIFWKEKKIA